MFYSYEILARKRGKFGVIWCAATHKKALSKREYIGVNIIKACHDIEDYICVRVPSGSGSRPRFSLYLSSQLMYGTLTVYHKQVDFLFTEAKDFIEKLTARIGSGHGLDLDPRQKCDVTLPDPVERYNPDLEWENVDDVCLDMLQPVEMFTPSLRRQTRRRPGQDTSPFRPEHPGSPSDPTLKPDFGLGYIGSPHTRPSDELQIPEEASTRTRPEPVPENDLPEMDINNISFFNDIPAEMGLYHPEPEEQGTKPDQPTQDDDPTKKDKAAKKDEPAKKDEAAKKDEPAKEDEADKKDEPAKKDKTTDKDQQGSEPVEMELLPPDITTPTRDAQLPAEPAPVASPEARNKRPLEEEETPRSPHRKTPPRKASKKSLDFSESPVVTPPPPRQPLIRRRRQDNLVIDREIAFSRTRQLQNMRNCSEILRLRIDDDVFQHPQRRPASALDLLRRPGIPWCNRLMPCWKKGAKTTKNAPVEGEPLTPSVDTAETSDKGVPTRPQEELPSAADLPAGVEERLQDGALGRSQDAANVPAGAADVPAGLDKQPATMTEEAIGMNLSPIPTDRQRQPEPLDQLQPDMSLNLENQSIEVARERASQGQGSLLGNISDVLNLEDSIAAGRSRADISRDGSLTDTSMRSAKRSRLKGPDSPTQLLPQVPEAETPREVNIPMEDVGMPSLLPDFDQDLASILIPEQKNGTTKPKKAKKLDSDQSFIEKDSWSPFEVEDNTALKIRLQKAKLEFKRLIDGFLSQDGVTTFRSICPPNTNSRSTAAMYFGFLLGDASAPHVKLVPEQDEPYGEIIITEGPAYRRLY